ncbi:hypothetical protein R75461_07668 [Paraburkholderia nemoris]|uniref:hypothetical protein n=1 Tax=Paraburkholderia nemoris TaxID=2793076 RepID=UPI0019091624|nr:MULTISPECIES: hypothetical protein [Paraburkholderia]MBK3786430.1 hypothetical protein [Paraburkholderia aspalathi]CAE6855150.1 hypothetical protein R75461_07668 [Paraburkholderia nemoris]
MRKLYKVKQTNSLGEAAERLSLTLGEPVTQADILRLMADGELGVYWFLEEALMRPSSLDATSRSLFHDDKRDGEVKFQSGLFRIDMQSNSAAREWVRKLAVGDAWDGRSFNGTVLLAGDGSVWELMKFAEYDVIDGISYFCETRFPGQGDIVVTADELERIEAKFDRADQAGDDATCSESSAKARATLQKQVAALALLLAEKSNRYKKGDTPNASQIAEGVRDILDRLPDANRHGLSPSNLRANIAAGMELLSK